MWVESCDRSVGKASVTPKVVGCGGDWVEVDLGVGGRGRGGEVGGVSGVGCVCGRAGGGYRNIAQHEGLTS